MKLLAPAKINLYLDVVSRRPDGYHEIETIFQTVSLCDRLEFKPGNGNGNGRSRPVKLEVRSGTRGPLKDFPRDDGNIAWRAADRFFKAFDLKGSCRMRLTKNIPVQAGLGGGSSDAAAVLTAARRSFLKGASGRKAALIPAIARDLGADVPFFLEGGCAFAGGIGEKIAPLAPAPRFWAVVVKPGVGLSTPDVYRWYDEKLKKTGPPRARGPKRTLKVPGTGERLTYHPENNRILSLILQGKSPREWAKFLYNCFEEVVFPRVPELARIKEVLVRSGAEGALMSGSGSALYGIAASKPGAERLKRRLKGLGVKVWVVHSTG